MTKTIDEQLTRVDEVGAQVKVIYVVLDPKDSYSQEYFNDAWECLESNLHAYVVDSFMVKETTEQTHRIIVSSLRPVLND